MTRRDSGFTLIEALVATAVFALLLSALYQGLTVGWHGLRKAGAEDAAMLVLSQRLASSGVETPLETSANSGTAPGGISWQTRIVPYTPTAPAGDARLPAYQGFWITVSVRWQNIRFGTEQSLQATTLKIKKAS